MSRQQDFDSVQSFYELKKDGVTILPSAVTSKNIEKLRVALTKSIKTQNEKLNQDIHKNDLNMVHNLMLKDDIFLAILDTPNLIEILDYTLSNTSIIYAYQSSSMPPKGKNYSSRVHVDSPRFIPNYPTNAGAIIALNDFTEDNGAPYFLKGSHQFTEIPSDNYFYRKAEQITCWAGDIIFFNARTYHSGGDNKTSDYRHALTMNFCRSFMRQRFDFPKMVPQNVEKKLSLLQRRLLGYNVRVPQSLEQFYAPIEERLYMPDQG